MNYTKVFILIITFILLGIFSSITLDEVFSKMQFVKISIVALILFTIGFIFSHSKRFLAVIIATFISCSLFFLALTLLQPDPSDEMSVALAIGVFFPMQYLLYILSLVCGGALKIYLSNSKKGD